MDSSVVVVVFVNIGLWISFPSYRCLWHQCICRWCPDSVAIFIEAEYAFNALVAETDHSSVLRTFHEMCVVNANRRDHFWRYRIAWNKYRRGTSDAISLSSVVVSLITMSFDDFLPQKMAIFVIQKITQDIQTDGWTDWHDLLQRCVVTSNKQDICRQQNEVSFMAQIAVWQQRKTLIPWHRKRVEWVILSLHLTGLCYWFATFFYL